MSNFVCEYCGTPHYDTKYGYYTECEHYKRDFTVGVCYGCGKLVVLDDDMTGSICTCCGGKNRRIE